MFAIFYVGVNTGLRISDIVKLNYNDIRNSDGTMKIHISIVEKKTNTLKRFPIVNGLYTELDKYTKNMRDGEYIFKSHKGQNKPITTTQAYRIISNAATNIGLEEVGTHTLRKTFGYHHYKQFKDIAILQQIFNHSSPTVTLRYLGIDQDEIDKSYSNFCL